MLEFNLKQLEAFVAAAEQGSFTRAAQSLYLTQSTVSAHIQTLEKALGRPLFLRDAKKPIVLTDAGRALYPRAREILAQCQALQDLCGSGSGLLELAASTAPCRCLLPELMADFLKGHPGCRYRLRRGDSAQVHRWLGFVGARLDESRFRYQPLLRDRLVLVTANDGPYPELRRRSDRRFGISCTNSEFYTTSSPLFCTIGRSWPGPLDKGLRPAYTEVTKKKSPPVHKKEGDSDVLIRSIRPSS